MEGSKFFIAGVFLRLEFVKRLPTSAGVVIQMTFLPNLEMLDFCNGSIY